MEPMKIRGAALEDTSSIAALLDQLGYPSKYESVEQRIRLHLNDPSTILLIAEIGGSVVGFSSFHLIPLIHDDGYMGRITAFVVDKENRRQGIGKALIQKIETFGLQMGCKRFEVASNENREDAHRFYERFGYKPTSKRFIKKV
jgi:GNAT superfamily N-acetyltransferase